MAVINRLEDKYVKFDEKSNFTEVREEFKNGDYPIHLDGYFKEEQLASFAKEFRDIKELHFINKLECHNLFLNKLKNLEILYLHFYSDIKTEVDFSQITPLKRLGTNWYPKYMLNLNTQKSIEYLSVSDYKAKDFTPISALNNLKFLSTHSGSLKSLEGIQNFKNLIALDIIAHRSLTDISQIKAQKNLKYLKIDYCWKMQDFSPIGELQKLEILNIEDCKKLESIKFIKDLPKLEKLSTLGTTIINDYDTTPAKDVPIFFGSLYKKYNKQYPEKEIKGKAKTWSSYL
ncbi:MAG: hypothetical protein JKY08_09495 [Flavobacteriaceae bacterium]|nr:hypothetical protein [Flavobacteriaceae bacterium]